jgi:hypothetical protein
MLVPFLAALVTWLTGFIPVWSTGSVPLYNFAVSQYGLPLFWKTRSDHGPIREIESVYLSRAFYSWDIFVVDTLLIAGVFYLLLLWSRRGSSLFQTLLIVVSSAWVAIATALYAWSSQQGVLTNGLPVPWMGLSSHGVTWYYNLMLFVVDVAFVAGIEYLVLFLYRGIRWSKLSTGPMSYASDPE